MDVLILGALILLAVIFLALASAFKDTVVFVLAGALFCAVGTALFLYPITTTAPSSVIKNYSYAPFTE
jgi:hypothetical protein